MTADLCPTCGEYICVCAVRRGAGCESDDHRWGPWWYWTDEKRTRVCIDCKAKQGESMRQGALFG